MSTDANSTPPNAKYQRTLTIVNKGDLPDDTTLMLAFRPDGSAYKYRYPVCWRVTTFPASKPGAAAAIYHNQLAFVYPQVDERDVILANTWRSVDLSVGQKTSLKKQENGVHVFTDPVSTGVERAVVVENVTDDNKNIALGFTSDPSLPPTSILYFDGIGPNSNIVTYFSPIVSAHVAAQYQQGQVIRGEIATPEIWSADLSALKESTVLIFSRNKATGQYSLKPALAL